ncbi:hypothetical protein EOPP23_09890 [Endozoicomonas sp. OPT23]|uniref:hypothetical protein n=1 Tax=Endozoicomonas sp. OPT23 TaxID=2072845 RepID=UPI00129B16AB|nr:hypothetical protein [Endozoicomonas sp. OPT23]MRI33293.1 hypothetical protein [Endozoicomonas sp. OPT23]
MSMQAFPVCNAHAHTNPILGYVHILGLEVTPECTLRVGKGGYFESQILCINEDGSGWIKSDHEITIESVNGKFTGKGVVKF